MNRYPVFSIFAFVGLAMAIAVGYHRIQLSDLESKIEGQESFAKASSFSSQAKNVVREIANASESGSEEIKNCQCVAKGQRTSSFVVQGQENCSAESLVYQSEFEKMPALFRERRSSTAAEFPRICITRILHATDAVLYNEKKCASHTPLCVTEEYVNLVYNLYADVFSCFELPQKEILPWFMVNGGFHLNAKNGISGLQMTSAEAKVYFAQAIATLEASPEAACLRLRPFAQKLKLNFSNECFLISPPENPLLSFLIFAEKYKETRPNIQTSLQHKKSFTSDEQDHQLPFLTLQALSHDPNKDLLERMNKAVQEINRDFKEGTCVSDFLPSR